MALVTKLLAAAGGVRSVLDLPCGTGRLLEPLGRAGYRVVGGDVSAAMLEVGSGRSAPLVRATAAHLPFRDGAFDVALSVRFLFHVEPGPERTAILAELGRVASRLVVGEVRFRGTAKHLGRYLRSRVGLSRRYRPAPGTVEIERELADAGLSLLALRPVSRIFSDKAFFVAAPISAPGAPMRSP